MGVLNLFLNLIKCKHMRKKATVPSAQNPQTVVIEDLQGLTPEQLHRLLDHLGGETSLLELGKTLRELRDRYTDVYLHALAHDVAVGEILVSPLVHYEDRYALQSLIDIAEDRNTVVDNIRPV